MVQCSMCVWASERGGLSLCSDQAGGGGGYRKFGYFCILVCSRCLTLLVIWFLEHLFSHDYISIMYTEGKELLIF